MLPRVTATGNLASDPELRFTPNGAAVATMTVMCNERRKQQDGSYADGAVIPLRVEVWNEQAEHVAESLRRGVAVTVTGVLIEDRYEKDGTTVYRVKCRADDVAASLRYAVARPIKAARKTDEVPSTVPDAWAVPAASDAAPF